jgi:UV DNA damage endonuclease
MDLRKKKIFAGRTCRKNTFAKEGLKYVGDLGLQNIKDLYTILQWNEKNNIRFYRVGSDLFPWSSEYEYKDLPQYKEVCDILTEIGKYATKHKHRLTYHPGPFNILGSQKPDVVKRTMIDLRHHSEIFDLMGFEPSVYNKINIHVGAAYKDKYAVLKQWCTNYHKVDANTKKRLTLENDDKPKMFTTQDLYHHAHSEIGIPIVFDFHHHRCNPGDFSAEDSLRLAVTTWPPNIKPIVHVSSTKQIEDPKAKVQAHANYIYESIDTFGLDVDIMVEAKHKEKAVKRLITESLAVCN